jgi:two-component system OmpR family response regulator
VRFDLCELTARVNAVARRYSGNPNPFVTLGNLHIDLAAHSIRREDQSVSLTASEWALLEALIQRQGMILSKAQLEERLYSFKNEIGSNTIEVHMSRLRKKLGTDLIETARGLGYKLRQC